MSKIYVDEIAGIANANTVAIPGHVIQVVQGVLTSPTTTTSNSDIATGLKTTITPSSSSNKVLIMFHATGSITSAVDGMDVSLYRNASVVVQEIVYADGYDANYGTNYVHPSAMYLDSPNSTSALEYEMYFSSSSNGTTTFGTSSKPCHIIVMEIAG